MAALYDINMENHFCLIVSVYLPVPSKKALTTQEGTRRGRILSSYMRSAGATKFQNVRTAQGCHLGSIQLCVMLFPEERVEDSGCLNGLLSVVAGLRNGGCFG